MSVGSGFVNMIPVQRFLLAALLGGLLLGCNGPRFQSADSSSTESPSVGDATHPSIQTETGDAQRPSTEGASNRDGGLARSNAAPSSPDARPDSSGEASSVPESITTEGGTFTSSAANSTRGDAQSSSTSETPPSTEAGSGEASSTDETLASSSRADDEPTSVDECPNHDQEQRGTCGCGHAPDPLCEALSNALAHRYSFLLPPSEPAPEAVTDSIGDAHLRLFQAGVDDDGSVILDGEGAYLSLPSGTLSKFTEATLDIWVRWWGGSENQRIVNFGAAPTDGDAPENYLSISPRGSNEMLSVQYRTDPDERGDRLDADFALPTNSLQHVTLVISSEKLTLYSNGEWAESISTRHRLQDLDDDQNWLGRALYEGYPNLGAAFYEFRIYGRALSADEVRVSHEVGLTLPGPLAP